MRRMLRGLIRLAAIGGLGWVVYRLIHERDDDQGETAPAVPGRGRAAAPEGTGSPAASEPATGTGMPSVRSIGVGEVPEHIPRWVEPEGEGVCPVTHPVKANLTSGIFHEPAGRHYERTRADRCYRDAEAAESDGLRPSKT